MRKQVKAISPPLRNPPFFKAIDPVTVSAGVMPVVYANSSFATTLPPPPLPMQPYNGTSNGNSSPETRKVAASPARTEARKVIRRVAPEYPEMARRTGVYGEVVIAVTINNRGKVTSAKALSGHPVLRGPAILAANFWKFTPVDDPNGKTEELARITFRFSSGNRIDNNYFLSGDASEKPDRRR
jgi:TonB family protein